MALLSLEVIRFHNVSLSYGLSFSCFNIYVVLIVIRYIVYQHYVFLHFGCLLNNRLIDFTDKQHAFISFNGEPGAMHSPYGGWGFVKETV